jgi:uncharacterized protein YheU (UPF0270 family)
MTADTPEMTGIEVPWKELADDTLQRVIEEFITREGTDYGYAVSLETKVAEVRAQLRRGKAAVVFDAKTETVSLVARG